MTDNMLRVLTQLVRERKALDERERRHAQRERQLIDSLREVLPSMGYRVVPASGTPAVAVWRMLHVAVLRLTTPMPSLPSPSQSPVTG